ncbi:transcriptional regulator, TetR family [Fictibacillus solisalsi]|uniref:Transcriptional regulator, TetR family n=1 Tax=Fictibacillus solisalsi TaxID=459525 RepID=A0A1H0A229_9BACL|nr:TetR/AcrR family transcriptional regulator [Fictibacillus solisalsi]SDN27852.1 transcriptional regulator, TetR family [Fictibacillus solisalsi]
MPLNEEQLQQKRDERREQILSAALKVFARRGLIGTKMSMISEEAGISQGLMYRYFTSKDELFITLVERAIQGSIEGTRQIHQMPGSPLEKLTRLTEEILDEDGQLYFLLMHQVRTSDEVPEKAKALLEYASMDMYVDMLKPVFEEGQKNGDLAEGDISELISCYFTVISGLMTLNIPKIKGFQLPRVELLMRMFTRPQ